MGSKATRFQAGCSHGQIRIHMELATVKQKQARKKPETFEGFGLHRSDILVLSGSLARS
jgi:hypothetical protein